MERWAGRVALVSGASSGIGAAIVKALTVAGLKVVGCARREDKMKNLANDLKGERGSFLPIKSDLGKEEDIHALFETIKEAYGGVDICVNNAVTLFKGNSLLDGDPNEWRHMLDINVTALCLCTKLAVASMRDRGVDDGHIINISSITGHLVPAYPNLHFYSGTKFAVQALTEGLRQELRRAKSNIRASSISPALVKTEAIGKAHGEEVANQMFSSLYYLHAEDIAATALHILSAPPHVEINDVIIRPIAKPSAKS